MPFLPAYALRLRPTLPSAVLLATTLIPAAFAQSFRIERSVILTGHDHHFYTQSRAAVIPGPTPRVILTTQETDPRGSHGYKDMYMLESTDLGRTWSPPSPIESLRRKRMPEGHDFVIGDVCPQWHAATRRVLATGKTFGFRGGTTEDRAFERVSYAVFDPATNQWSDLRLLTLPAADRAGRPFLEPNAGCHQRFDLPNGEILLPIRYRHDAALRHYTSIVARCRFDGATLTYLEHGSELSIPRDRGLYEPSVTGFQGRYFLTLRADHSGFVARSADGLHYEPSVEWRFDDGQLLGNYNTQQHWLVRGDTLFLLYTRRGANNDHVFRHRAPIFIAEVDPDKLVVRRATERIVFPEENADLGSGYALVDVTADETWVVTSEIPPRGSRNYNRVLLARLIWPRR